MPGSDKPGEGTPPADERETRLSRFEPEIQKGIDSAERGELIDVDEAFDRVVARIGKAAGCRPA